MRIIINSSKLVYKIERNLTRSSKGWRESRASSKTRRLNSIQLSSRLIYTSGRISSEVVEEEVRLYCIDLHHPGMLRWLLVRCQRSAWPSIYVYSIMSVKAQLSQGWPRHKSELLSVIAQTSVREKAP